MSAFYGRCKNRDDAGSRKEAILHIQEFECNGLNILAFAQEPDTHKYQVLHFWVGRGGALGLHVSVFSMAPFQGGPIIT